MNPNRSTNRPLTHRTRQPITKQQSIIRLGFLLIMQRILITVHVSFSFLSF